MNHVLLALGPDDPIGKISPPVAGLAGDPKQSLGKLLSVGIMAFVLVASMAVLAYMLWGAFDWITSGGDKARVEKAQLKITHAVIGILVLIAAFTIFQVVGVNMLGIITSGPNGYGFKIPTIGP
ncbi:MAG: hypothetical protein RI947_274 [Candidatus Parcubacteria bacterium]|jgi:hypothetical protein